MVAVKINKYYYLDHKVTILNIGIFMLTDMNIHIMKYTNIYT
jgi:hypothetical protein